MYRVVESTEDLARFFLFRGRRGRNLFILYLYCYQVSARGSRADDELSSSLAKAKEKKSPFPSRHSPYWTGARRRSPSDPSTIARDRDISRVLLENTIATSMGRPLLLDVWERPATSAVVVVCTSVWYYLQSKGLGYDEVGMSYAKVVGQRQYWRCVTASFSHVSLLHLLFNMSSLWSLGAVEQMGARGIAGPWGTGWYIRYTLVMLVGTMALVMGTYHALLRWARQERYEHVTAVGYSCVVFGWMTVLSVRQPTHSLSLLGVVNLPINLAPFGSLIFTSIIVPQASFVGHLAGIVMGYLVGWDLFVWVDWYWFAVILFWVGVVFLGSLKATTNLSLPFIQVHWNPLSGSSAAAGSGGMTGTGHRLGGAGEGPGPGTVAYSRLLNQSVVGGAGGVGGGGVGDDMTAIARVLRGGSDENV